MARLTLQFLPAFRSVATLENLRAAAEALHLTPSAVSQQIRGLEEQLGFALFERHGRRLALNPAGAALLRAVEPALDQLEQGVRAAQAALAGDGQRIRVTLLPSFAQRWLLPRIGRWHARHPDIALELHTSQDLVDLAKDGFHAALRQGAGRWRGLAAERLTDSPFVAVGAPGIAKRLAGQPTEALAALPLLGSVRRWELFFAAAGVRTKVNPVATFNDAGLMLQATEQGLGIALARELLAADALAEGRLARLAPLEIDDDESDAYWLAYPPALADWPPLAALRRFLADELAASERALRRVSAKAGTGPAGPTGSRSRAPSARRAGGRAR